ncbi:hypothetical protein HO173_009683 [Letharia columbiana]|uniref:Major facilitator superfamily (MFS) profile domain-containing protein n=1 Tax=Letharia columbiana TaxID=112416 RepID=A0A8H6FP41_9LECA|nr:uncharacterized protein HO173_009683 [Letharia columbiana]KAF6232089.1 hypothetical protein HO173_009683 [Letharia columbiana]
MATSTTVMEMATLPSSKDQPIPLQTPMWGNSELPGPIASHVVETKQRWNSPRINTYRLAAIFFAFLNFGMNDGSYGALVPYIEADYGLSYTVTSLVFLSPFAGYTFAALFSDRLHRLGGRRGITVLAPSCKVIAYIVIATHPPYPAVVTILALAGVGNGLLDAAWNAWIGTLDHTNQLLGLLHGCYGLGATISPLIATTMVTKGHLGWWTFEYIMIGVVTLEICGGTWAFWKETGAKYRDDNSSADSDEKGKTSLALKQKVTWICAVFLLAYAGTEVSLGGWIVTFMIRVRHGQPFASGMTATGFWLGITIGRVTLGFITPKIGERLAVALYIICSLGLELLFWLVPQFIVSAVAISLVGFFIGPLFPSAVIMATKLLPQELHVAAIGFAAAVGGGGAAVLPFAVGAIANARGVQTLQPIILALLAVLLGIWLLLPRIPKHLHES